MTWNYDFPNWLLCGCKTDEGFREAREILINEFGFIPSPQEEGASDQALILPIPGIDVQEKFAGKDPTEVEWSWGIGRVRFSYKEPFGGHCFEFKYYNNAPREFVETNPSRAAMMRLNDFLHPSSSFGGNNIFVREIPFPY